MTARSYKRWNDNATENAGPFGMSFVDIVACALICVIGLLIIWLQFIDPMGVITGRKSVKSISAGSETSSKLESSSSLNQVPLLVSILTHWDDLSLESQGQVVIVINCESEQVSTPPIQAPNRPVKFVELRISARVRNPDNCFLNATLEQGQGQGQVQLEIRALVEGRRLFQTLADTKPLTEKRPIRRKIVNKKSREAVLAQSEISSLDRLNFEWEERP